MRATSTVLPCVTAAVTSGKRADKSDAATAKLAFAPQVCNEGDGARYAVTLVFYCHNSEFASAP